MNLNFKNWNVLKYIHHLIPLNLDLGCSKI